MLALAWLPEAVPFPISAAMPEKAAELLRSAGVLVSNVHWLIVTAWVEAEARRRAAIIFNFIADSVKEAGNVPIKISDFQVADYQIVAISSSGVED